MERTPLYFSCSLGAYEIAEYLIQRGADINAVTKIKRSVLSKTCWNGQEKFTKLLLE
jgi:ankyrin repeat protein